MSKILYLQDKGHGQVSYLSHVSFRRYTTPHCFLDQILVDPVINISEYKLCGRKKKNFITTVQWPECFWSVCTHLFVLPLFIIVVVDKSFKTLKDAGSFDNSFCLFALDSAHVKLGL